MCNCAVPDPLSHGLALNHFNRLCRGELICTGGISAAGEADTERLATDGEAWMVGIPMETDCARRVDANVITDATEGTDTEAVAESVEVATVGVGFRLYSRL